MLNSIDIEKINYRLDCVESQIDTINLVLDRDGKIDEELLRLKVKYAINELRLVRERLNTFSNADVYIFTGDHKPVTLPYTSRSMSLPYLKEIQTKLIKTKKYNSVTIVGESKLDGVTYAKLLLT